MKLSYNWLNQYINVKLPVNELSEVLTNTGLEVEGVERFETIPGGLQGLVVGHVISKEKHPNADKLNLTKVDVGLEEPLSIVCGAPNVAEGQKVVVAQVGTTVHPIEGEPFKIKKAKIRGEASFGMLCSESEIGLENKHDGIMELPNNAKIGMAIADLFEIETDYVFEIGLTPNRCDAQSHVGSARDVVAAINASGGNASLQIPQLKQATPKHNLPIEVVVENNEKCPRYAGAVLTNIQVKESPTWLKNCLNAVGVRPINNVVDITNFVLHELGQPLHAFDYDQINGQKVVVKTLKEGTNFTTLDDVERKLGSEDLMICNATEGMCIAGVFGGSKSGVSQQTKTIFLESAYFDAISVRKTSTKHGLRTDAASRYEKGADPNMAITALQRAIDLLVELADAELASNIIDIYPKPIAPAVVELSLGYIDTLIGVSIPYSTVQQILTDLDIEIISNNNGVLTLHVPPYRADVMRPEDVVEEILRIYGFNNVPIANKVHSSIQFSNGINENELQNQWSDMLTGLGFQEIQTNSISKSQWHETLPNNIVKLQNNMTSELDIMRGNLLFDGLEVLAYNINHKNADLKLFEFGNFYTKTETGYNQHKRLVVYLTGNHAAKTWHAKQAPSNYYHLKGVVEAMLNKMNIPKLKTAENTNNMFAYGLNRLQKKKDIVQFGAVKPALLKKFGIEQPVFYAEFNWENVVDFYQNKTIKFQPVSKFPKVQRDIAFVINDNVTFNEVKSAIQQATSGSVHEIALFDVFKNEEKLGANKKSYALSLTMQNNNKTLTDKEIDKTMNKAISQVKKQFNAVVRS